MYRWTEEQLERPVRRSVAVEYLRDKTRQEIEQIIERQWTAVELTRLLVGRQGSSYLRQLAIEQAEEEEAFYERLKAAFTEVFQAPLA